MDPIRMITLDDTETDANLQLSSPWIDSLGADPASSHVELSSFQDPADLVAPEIPPVHEANMSVVATLTLPSGTSLAVQSGTQFSTGGGVHVMGDITYSRINIVTQEGNSTTQSSTVEPLLQTSEDTIVSTVFHLSANLLPSLTPDILLKSTDGVAFYLHTSNLSSVSINGFGELLPDTVDGAIATVVAHDDFPVLNIILHAVYDIPSTQFEPTWETISLAIRRMSFYGLTVFNLINPSRSLFHLIYSHGRYRPLDVYILAAHYSLEELAVLVSSHLLSFQLFTLTDEAVDQMGSLYFKRLMFLHLNRMTALKNILGVPPPLHPQPTTCKDSTTRAWGFATVEVLLFASPSMSPHILTSYMKRGLAELTCVDCRRTYEEALAAAAEKWSLVKATI